MKSKLISEKTKADILDAVWRLLAETGRSELSQNEIAAAAGVTRQAVFYAFGNRAGLLTAALRHRDATLPYMHRFSEIRASGPVTCASITAYTANWLDYLPHVYPVAVLLRAAALTDADAKAAIDDRLVGALLQGFCAIANALAERRPLPGGRTAASAAEEIWAATHIDAWRLLVVERRWTPVAFRESRLAMVPIIFGAEP